MVEDDPQTLRYVRDALAEADYPEVVTSDPGEAPGLIRTKRPRLVLLDLRLPATDGIELLERVPELADLPVICPTRISRRRVRSLPTLNVGVAPLATLDAVGTQRILRWSWFNGQVGGEDKVYSRRSIMPPMVVVHQSVPR